MLKKQDRQGVRRPADIERKYDLKKMRSDTAENKKVATEISENEKGISLKVESLDKEINGENGVKARLDLKVETDKDGNLKSRVHVQGNEFTVDTDNFQLDEEGNVAISGTFNTKSSDGRYSTKIDGGTILVNADSYYIGLDDAGKLLYGHQIICFTGIDGEKYALIAYGKYLTSLETGEQTFYYQGVLVEKVD